MGVSFDSDAGVMPIIPAKGKVVPGPLPKMMQALQELEVEC